MIETRVEEQLNELIWEWIGRLDPEAWKLAATPETAASVLSWAIYGAGLQWAVAANLSRLKMWPFR